MHKDSRSLAKMYIAGFIICIVLTLAAFAMTNIITVSANDLAIVGIAAVSFLAVVQLIIQLMFFLHLGEETKPRLNALSFIFMTIVVVIIGFGSLWIMNNLDYHMMPDDIEEYIKDEEGISKPE